MQRSTKTTLATMGVAMAALISQFSEAQAETTARQILSGEADKNVIEFTVPTEAIPAWEKRGFFVSRYDTRNVISRFTDPQFKNCTTNAGLVPIAKYGPTVAGALVGEPVPPLVNPVVDDALSAVGIESYGDCEKDWLKKLQDAKSDIKFDVIDVALGQVDTFESGMTADFLDLSERTHDLGLWIGKTETQVKNIKNRQESLEQQSRALITAFNNFSQLAGDHKKQLDKIIDAQEKAQRELELRTQLEEKRQLVQGSAAALSLVAQLSFSKDPVAVARINTGISSIAKITDSVFQLSSGLSLGTGAKLLLSTNIAGGALSLISMFGPQNSETSMMQAQLSAIREDISDLRIDMDKRFDRLEDMIVEATKYIDQRLENIDQRLKNIEDNLQTNNATLTQLYKLSRDSFDFLISTEFQESFRACNVEVNLRNYSYDAVADCINKSSLYAREGASKFAISSGSLYNYKVDVDVGAVAGANLPPIEQVGYLDAVLRNADADGKLTKSYSVSPNDLVSPPDWATAVDNYSKIIADPSQFNALRERHITRAMLVQPDNYGKDIADIIKVGETAKASIQTIRKAGVDFALDMMTDRVAKLAESAAGMVVDDLSKRDLSILEVGPLLDLHAELRSPDNRGPYGSDGTVRYSVLYVAMKYFYVTQGPQKGQKWEPQRRATHFNPPSQVMPKYGEAAAVDSWSTYVTRNYDALKPGFSVEYDRSILDLRDKLPDVNLPYLEKVPVKQLTDGAKTDLFDIYHRVESWAPQEPPKVSKPVSKKDALVEPIYISDPNDDQKKQLKAACDEIANMRKVASAYAELIRTSYTKQDTAWHEALSDLPETSWELCAEALTVLPPSDAANQELPVKDFVKATIQQALGSKIDKLRTSFDQADQSGGMDIIDARLRGLRNLIHAPAPN